MYRTGRPKNKNFQELGFELIKLNGKYVASCHVCNKNLQNTAATRLKGHRNICKMPDTENSTITEGSIITENTIIVLDDGEHQQTFEPISLTENQVESATQSTQNIEEYNISLSNGNPICVIPVPTDETIRSPSTSSIGSSMSSKATSLIGYYDSRPSTSSSICSASSSVSQRLVPITGNKQRKSTVNKSNILNYMDKLTDKEETELNEALANLVFGCNLPLRIVESKYFKRFMYKVRPAYSEKVPGRKALSTTLLDKAYENCISNTKRFIGEQSVLLIDGWKNSSNNSKLVVTMIHNANGEQGFVQAWDLTGISETGSKLAEIVMESMDIAKELYDTDVYATVSDNASNMGLMGTLTSHVLWHSTCTSHTANLLAKDVLNIALTENVVSILKEFKKPDFEKYIVDNGGIRIKLPCETRWCSYRDSYKCFITNLGIMKQISANPKLNKVNQDIAKMIFDDQIVELVKQNIKMFDPICQLINIAQSTSCSIADAANLWLDLNVPDEFKTSLKARKKMALNQYVLAAFYLHPNMDQRKLDKNQMDIVNNFLLHNLYGDGINDFYCYRSEDLFFKDLFEKKIKNPIVFWDMAKINHPLLADLATKLLKMPASSAQIERVFSSWGHVHSLQRNRLTFERSKKLLHIYYALRISDEPFEDDASAK